MRSLQVSWFPAPSVSGTDLAMHHYGRRDGPPLIAVDRIEAQVGWLGLLRMRVSYVELEGLRIAIPPKGSNPPHRADKRRHPPSVPQIGRIVANGAQILIISRKPGKEPLKFDLHELTVTDVDMDRPMRYEAKLTNAKPPGLINSPGQFGPWNAEEPGATPLSGDYTFRNADLSVFKGIGGHLSATGSLTGELSRIQTKGITETPDFVVNVSGLPVHLLTEYEAVVDGTDGDTYLTSVRGRFGETSVIARGAVEGTKGQKGKAVRLDVYSEKARIEDVLRLAVKSPEPLLKGPMYFSSKFLLPQGPDDVVAKLELDGKFGVAGSSFTGKVQEKVDTLSRKGQGEPENTDIDNVPANLRGDFRLRGGKLSLSGLSFQVPGAQVFLNGSYGLKGEELDFDGRLLLDAPVSETTGGFKGMLLKVVDPLFARKRSKGSAVPIKIGGTRSHPRFGLDIEKTLTGK
ncbi:MAG: AsmA-like C-terminal region-containing protein [Bryobacteraceae bacterium]